ncbi:MAG: L-histidine N(alpha)-methyltransferase [Blastocatellia bacterium AA13]|nr:MAG: L-histidine N(alpha)-methyltransferase [Blastocatellia bacterium AA13]
MTPKRSERLTIISLGSDIDSNEFARDVAAGLTSTPKALLPKYFYDDLGSRLFEAICLLPEYYLTRAESEILSSNADEIAGSVAGAVRLIEFGSGSSEKTRFLIEAFLRRQHTLHYLPVDISRMSLERSAREMLHDYPGLSVTAYAMRYAAALSRFSAEPPVTGVRNLALFLGSNIGNFDAEESRAFLQGVRKVVGKGGALLLGADLRKSPDVLLPAYNDSLGVTAAFNLNILVRINRELGGEFDISTFEHRVKYDQERGRVEMHIASTRPQAVRIEALDLEIDFAEGETIHTEDSYKFDLAQLSALAADTGFSLDQSWRDSLGRFSFNLLVAG